MFKKLSHSFMLTLLCGFLSSTTLVGLSSCSDDDDPLCTNTCSFSNDGDCDDGGPGADFNLCALGTDCADCGSR